MVTKLSVSTSQLILLSKDPVAVDFRQTAFGKEGHPAPPPRVPTSQAREPASLRSRPGQHRSAAGGRQPSERARPAGPARPAPAGRGARAASARGQPAEGARTQLALARPAPAGSPPALRPPRVSRAKGPGPSSPWPGRPRAARTPLGVRRGSAVRASPGRAGAGQAGRLAPAPPVAQPIDDVHARRTEQRRERQPGEKDPEDHAAQPGRLAERAFDRRGVPVGCRVGHSAIERWPPAILRPRRR